MNEEYDLLLSRLVQEDIELPGKQEDVLAELAQDLPHAKAFFRLFERLENADFGAPGAFAGCVEGLSGYDRDLLESLRRKPVFVTVLLAVRLVNEAKTSLLNEVLRELLRIVGDESLPSDVREVAEQALEPI